MKIEHKAIIAAVNYPNVPAVDTRGLPVRMYPFIGEGSATAGGALYRSVCIQPSRDIAVAITKLRLTRTVSSTFPLVGYLKLQTAKQIADLLAAGAGYTHSAESPNKKTILIQSPTYADLAGRATIFSGGSPSGPPDRTGAIYRGGDGAANTGGAGPANQYKLVDDDIIILPVPVILWGDDAGGLPGALYTEVDANTQPRVTWYGWEIPLDSEVLYY